MIHVQAMIPGSEYCQPAGVVRAGQSRRASNSARVFNFADPGGVMRSLIASSLVQNASFSISAPKYTSRVNLVRFFLVADVAAILLENVCFCVPYGRGHQGHMLNNAKRESLNKYIVYSIHMWVFCSVSHIPHLNVCVSCILLAHAITGHAPFILNIVV